MTFNVDGNNLVKLRPHQLPYSHEKFVNNEITEMVQCGIIELSTAAWRSTVVVVNEKGRKLRLCIDFREVNKFIQESAYMLPRIDEILEDQRANEWFTRLDLLSGYRQIPLAKNFKDYTAFVVNRKNSWEFYRFNVIPFGLKVGPSEFQRIMNEVFRKFLGNMLHIYLDELTVGSKEEEHLKTLRKSFQEAKTRVTIQPNQCAFAQKLLYIYGFFVDRQGVHTDPKMVGNIRHLNLPTSAKGVQRILGLLGYYRKFVPHFDTISEPLVKLTRKDEQFQWTENEETALERLKLLTTTPPVLKHPDPSLPFRLYTDASDKGIGAVLSQIQEDGEHPTLLYSRR